MSSSVGETVPESGRKHIYAREHKLCCFNTSFSSVPWDPHTRHIFKLSSPSKKKSSRGNYIFTSTHSDIHSLCKKFLLHMPKGLPIPLSSLVNLNAEYHHYFTGQRDNLHVCCLKYSYSMRLQGPQIWSNIPFNFYALPSICPIIKVNSKATICHCIASLPSFDYLVAFKFTYITTFFLSYHIPFLKNVYTTEQKWQRSDKNWNGSNSFCKETVYIRSATGP